MCEICKSLTSSSMTAGSSLAPIMFHLALTVDDLGPYFGPKEANRSVVPSPILYNIHFAHTQTGMVASCKYPSDVFW